MSDLDALRSKAEELDAGIFLAKVRLHDAQKVMTAELRILERLARQRSYCLKSIAAMVEHPCTAP